MTTGRPAAARARPQDIDLDLIRAEPGRIGLAVSGGSDSIALAVLLTEAFPDRSFVIFTVDHGLRPDAAEDVATVRALGRTLGHTVVALQANGAPVGSVQAWARAERLRLFAAAARLHDCAAVATGHTLDDQAETLLMRLARGSGLAGLAAIRARSQVDGLVLLRPLLPIRRDRLRAALVARGIGWREDPSNADPRFDRTAVRQLLPQLSAIGMSPERLAASAAHLARASEAIDEAARAHLARASTRDGTGAATLHRPAFCDAPKEVRLRALATLLGQVGGGGTPRFDALDAAERALCGEGDATLTLARAIVRARGLTAMIWREARNIAPLHLGPGENGVFDGRFRVRSAPEAPEARISAIGEANARHVPGRVFRPAVATAPGVFVGGELMAAPTLGVRRKDWPARAIVLSHVR